MNRNSILGMQTSLVILNTVLLTHCWGLMSDASHESVDKRMGVATENDKKKKDKARDVCEAPSVAPPTDYPRPHPQSSDLMTTR